MESCQRTVPQRVAVVEAHQLHEHVGDEHAQVFDIARLVLEGHDLEAGLLRAGSLGWRCRHLQDGAHGGRNGRGLCGSGHALARRRTRTGQCIVCGRSRLRRGPQLRLCGLRDGRRGGGNAPLRGRNGSSTRGVGRRGVGGRGEVAGGRLGAALGDVEGEGEGVLGGLWAVGGGEAGRGVLGAVIHVAPLAALGRGGRRRCWRRRRKAGLGRGRRVEAPCSSRGHGEARRGGSGRGRRAS